MAGIAQGPVQDAVAQGAQHAPLLGIAPDTDPELLARQHGGEADLAVDRAGMPDQLAAAIVLDLPAQGIEAEHRPHGIVRRGARPVAGDGLALPHLPRRGLGPKPPAARDRAQAQLDLQPLDRIAGAHLQAPGRGGIVEIV